MTELMARYGGAAGDPWGALPMPEGGGEQGRRHPLIDETKADLDVAYEEIRRAEEKVMAVERDYAGRMASLPFGDEAGLAAVRAELAERRQRLAFDNLLRMQAETIERFALLSAAFGVVAALGACESCVGKLRATIFRRQRLDGHSPDADRMLSEFAQALRAYWLGQDVIETDRRVRGAWAAIEHLLRSLGRRV